jgi:hypothetical protein
MSVDENALNLLQAVVGPWYESLENPQKAQENVLHNLAEEYAKTGYGSTLHAAKIEEIRQYQSSFPIVDYHGLLPYIAKVREGKYESLLSEPPECWVMTRGSTGAPKVLPATRTHLKQIFSCGARALVHHAVRKDNFDIFTGDILNLNFPSNVHTLTRDGREETYGYSSGTYAKVNPMFDRVSLLPRQEEIDQLGSGISRIDWEKRFELAYQKTLDRNVTATMGVTPVILAFAKYVKKRHGKKPLDLWNFKALFCTSVPKIQFNYAPPLRKYFGLVPVVEMYTATEGVFGQQYDDLPYVTPNYDTYLFEVQTKKGTKMLHDLKRGEWGRLIISSSMFPRYDIGDLIEAEGKNYFRVLGRRNASTLLEHRFYRLFSWLL